MNRKLPKGNNDDDDNKPTAKSRSQKNERTAVSAFEDLMEPVTQEKWARAVN
jgi:hypothetical protein